MKAVAPLLPVTTPDDRLSNEMPLLHLFSKHPSFTGQKRLEDIHFISTLHTLPNLRSVLVALERLGLSPERCCLFYKPYPYPGKTKTITWAVRRGYTVRPVEEINEALEALECELPPDARLILAEDGGHAFTAMAQRNSSLIPRIMGMVEQTTKGIRRITHAADMLGGDLAFPVLSLPDARIKKTLEPPHIASGVRRSLEAVLDESLGGRHRVAVLGCGVIGLEIANQLSRQGCRVSAYDPVPCQCGEADGRFDIVETAAQAVLDAHIVIGTSGEMSITDKVINNLAHRAIVVSASSDRVELNYDYINQLATEITPFYHRAFHDAQGNPVPIGHTYRLAHNRHEITLLADGMPLNFIGLGGMNDRVADCILTEIVVGCALIASGRYKNQSGILRDAFNEIDNEFGISRRFYDFQRAL